MRKYQEMNIAEESPRRRKRTQEKLTATKAVEEKLKTEMVHRNPIWHPLYEFEKKTAGNLLDIRDSLKVQEEDINALLAQINVCRKPSELYFQKNAFSGTPINDEVDNLKHKLKNALEKELYQLDEWRDEVEGELAKRTDDIVNSVDRIIKERGAGKTTTQPLKNNDCKGMKDHITMQPNNATKVGNNSENNKERAQYE